MKYKVNDIVSLEDMLKEGCNIVSDFADLKICANKDFAYLLQPLDNKKYKVFLAYEKKEDFEI